MPKRYDRDYFDRWYRKGGIGKVHGAIAKHLLVKA